MTYSYRIGIASLAVALLASIGCKEDAPTQRQPPPPAPKPTSCDGEGKVNDPSNLAMFPAKTGVYCIDPNASDRGFGEGARNPLEGICDLFDGECEIYKQFDVKRVVEARYVDGKGSGASIDIKLSKYASTSNAYAMFTKRCVGEGDPAHPDSPTPIEGGGAAALGWGNAYLWRGTYLAEITFNDVGTASDKQIKAKADALLPPFVKNFGAKLKGELALPAHAAALPSDKRLPLGIRFHTKKILGVEGTGAGAYGYYADGEVRWRIVSVVKPDADQAKDVLGTLSRLQAAAEEKGIGDDATRFMVKQTEWIVAQKGSKLLGVGDEARVLRSGMSPDEHRSKTLSQDAKRELLRRLLTESAK